MKSLSNEKLSETRINQIKSFLLRLKIDSEKLFAKNNFDTVYLSKNDPFIQHFKKLVPKKIKKKSIR